MSDLDRVLGRKPIQEVTTASAVPVVATVPAFRQTRRPVKKDDDENRKRHARLVSGVLGMTEAETSDNDSLFPEDAEETDGSERPTSGIRLKKPEFSQRNPDSPKDEQEQLLSPRAALVAPDVTPDSMTEIDPSDVPGPKGTSFKVGDTATEAPATAPAALDTVLGGGQDKFTSTMDTLLGHDRRQQPMQRPPSPASPATMETQAISPEAAAAMFIAPSGEAILAQGKPMADPVVGDGKTIFEAARRFM